MISAPQDEHRFETIAGIAGIASGMAWIAWAVLNGLHHGALDSKPPAVSARLFNLGALLTGAWNLLLIPVALALWRRFELRSPSLVLLYSASSILSLILWGYGGLTHSITPALETSYLLMSAVWWLGMGGVMRDAGSKLGIFTIVLGGFAALDFLFTFFEPMPFALYLLAAPKLPLAAIWSIAVGISLLTGRSARVATV